MIFEPPFWFTSGTSTGTQNCGRPPAPTATYARMRQLIITEIQSNSNFRANTKNNAIRLPRYGTGIHNISYRTAALVFRSV